MWHVAEVSFAAKVRQRIEAGRRRRDSNALRDVYDRFRGTSSKMVKTSLAQALHELQVGPSNGETKVPSNGETIDEICLAFDADRTRKRCGPTLFGMLGRMTCKHIDNSAFTCTTGKRPAL